MSEPSTEPLVSDLWEAAISMARRFGHDWNDLDQEEKLRIAFLVIHVDKLEARPVN